MRLDFTPSRDERAGLVSTRLKEGVKFINLSDMVGADDDDDPEAGA